MCTYTEEELRQAVKDSYNYTEVLRKLNLSVTGNSHRNIKNKIANLSIDASHFQGQANYPKDRRKKHYSLRLIHDESLKNRYTGKILTKDLLEAGVEYKCLECYNNGAWQGKKLTLEVDHKDGNWKNNKLENLRFLCPNCHSQTKNFTHAKTTYYCKCGNRKTKAAKTCVPCFNEIPKTDKRPSKEVLEKLVWEKPTTEIANDYGVSDKAVAKWCIKYNIPKPPRGYWTKQKALL